MNIGEKIFELRKKEGISQEEFGAGIGVSRQAVSKWENGETKPDIDKIKINRKKYNVSYEYLLDDTVEEIAANIEKKTDNEKEEKAKKEHKILKRILKIVLVVLIIYFIVFIYKLIMYVRIYLVSNSFSEENFSVVQDLKKIDTENNRTTLLVSTIKINGQIINKMYLNNNGSNNRYPNIVKYVNTNTNENYTLTWDNEKNIYIYNEFSDINLDNIDNLPSDIVSSYYPNKVLNIIIFSLNPTIIVLPNGTQIFYSINNKINAVAPIKPKFDAITENIKSVCISGKYIGVLLKP